MSKSNFWGWSVLFAALLSFTWAGCSDDDNAAIPASLKLSESAANLGGTAGKYVVAVFATGDWSAVKEGDWITPDALAGKGNGVINVAFGTNDKNEKRNATITVKSAGLPDQKITFAQDGNSFILNVSGKDTVEIEAAGGVMNLDIESNVAYKYELADWVTVVPTAAEATQSTISLAIAANPSLLARKAHIVIRNTVTNAEARKIVLVQKGVEVTVEGQSAAALGQVLTIPVAATSGWEAAFDGTGDHSWLTLEKMDGNLKVTVAKNTSTSVRTAKLKIQAGLGVENAKSITVTQAGRTGVTTNAGSIESFKFENVAVKEFTVTADEDAWSVATENAADATWLTVVQEEGKFTVSCENNTGDDRDAYVRISMNDGSSFARFRVVQDKYVASLAYESTELALSQGVNNVVLKATSMRGERLEVTSSDESWLTASQNITSKSWTDVVAAENPNGFDRTATLTVELINAAEEVVSTVVIRVIQNKKSAIAPSISLSAAEHTFTALLEADYKLTVTSNVPWDYKLREWNGTPTATITREGDVLTISYNGRGPIYNLGDFWIMLDIFPEGTNGSDPANQAFKIASTNPND